MKLEIRPGRRYRSDVVEIPTGSVHLRGQLDLPEAPLGVVILSHGHGEKRRGIRPSLLHETLLGSGFCVLQVETLTAGEEMFLASHNDHEIGAQRILDAARWLRSDERTWALPIGCVGECAGAPAAVLAAGASDTPLRAVVARGGHPAPASLPARCLAPVLLVSENRDQDRAAARESLARLGPSTRLVVVPGVVTRAEEPRVAECFARLALRWFAARLRASPRDPAPSRGEPVRRYRNRAHAGRVLAPHLEHLRARSDAVVLAASPRGAPVAFEVASELSLPFDVFFIRRFLLPGFLDRRIGVVATGGITLVADDVASRLFVSRVPGEMLADHARRDLDAFGAACRGERDYPRVADGIAILVDDGMATGTLMGTTVCALRALHPSRIVVAVPVASPQAVRALRCVAEEVVCPVVPESGSDIARWYDDFDPVGPREVRALLSAASSRLGALDG